MILQLIILLTVLPRPDRRDTADTPSAIWKISRTTRAKPGKHQQVRFLCVFFYQLAAVENKRYSFYYLIFLSPFDVNIN